MSNSVQIFSLDSDFITEKGAVLVKPVVAYQTWGKLNDEGDNAVLVCHALTGDSNAEDWFSGFFQEHLFDFDRQFVVCANVLGGCYGSTGPQSINPQTGERYQAHFPVVTIRDMVRLQQALFDSLGVQKIELAIGGSMGGMQVLEWAIMDSRIQKMIIIGTNAKHSGWAIGIGEAQRQAIMADKNWNNGFYPPTKLPEQGLAAARMMGMLTYRSYSSFEQRFGRETQSNKEQFKIESYLNYQGEKLVKRFDALTYIRLTQAMDLHDISHNRGTFGQVLKKIKIPTLVIGIDSDILYPPEEQRFLASAIPYAYYKEIKSIHGHDAFLIEFDQMMSIITPFIQMAETVKFSI